MQLTLNSSTARELPVKPEQITTEKRALVMWRGRKIRRFRNFQSFFLWISMKIFNYDRITSCRKFEGNLIFLIKNTPVFKSLIPLRKLVFDQEIKRFKILKSPTSSEKIISAPWLKKIICLQIFTESKPHGCGDF